MWSERRIPEYVNAGVEFLGVNLIDPNWFMRVDPALLNLQLKSRCVLGQVFGSNEDYRVYGYDRGLRALGLSRADAPYLGFTVPTVYLPMIASRGDVWCVLTDEWQRVTGALQTSPVKSRNTQEANGKILLPA